MAAAPSPDAGRQSLTFNGLRFKAALGILAHERGEPQPIQVDAELRMNQDIQRYQQRRYVAQVIEILLFNELMLAPRDTVEEGDVE